MPKNYKQQKTIAIITARGGSKRLPRKNLKILAGKPLIWYGINDAKKSKYISDVYVSTEDKEIASVSKKYGAKIINRPAELATDTATSDSALKHAIKILKFSGNVILLQPDTPIRGDDIDKSLEAYFKWEPSILVTIAQNGKYDGAIFLFNTSSYKKADYKWRALTYINPYIYMMSPRKSRMHIHYEEDLKKSEKLMRMSDEEYQKFSFKAHLAKETEFSDRIGKLQPYLIGGRSLENLRKKDEDLYKKLRDNPERVRILAGLPCGATCLDVGCSDGLITLEIAKNHKNLVTGIDIRSEAIKQANLFLKKLPKNLRQKINFLKAMPNELIKQKIKFDTVFFTEVLEHIDYTEHDKVLKELITLMNFKGNLIISIPNRYPAKHYEDEGRQRWDAPAHRAHFSKLSFQALLSCYFRKIKFYTLPNDKRPQDGIWLIASCTL